MDLKGSFKQLLMLLYKGLLLRKRHYIVTFLEITIFIVIASIPAIIFSQFPGPIDWKAGTFKQGNATIYKPFSPFEADSYSKKGYLFYTPNTTDSKVLMDRAIEIFKNSTAGKDYIQINNTVGFNSESAMEDYSMTISDNYIIIGTVFSDVTGNSLRYKIRYRSSSAFFHTDTAFRFISQPQPDNAYTSSYFLSWQASMEQAFIKMKQKSSNVFQVLMQRFPYPPYESDVAVTAMIAIIQVFFVYGFTIFLYVFVKRVVDEKANRSKELLKMMGMTDFNYWLSTFLNQFILGAIILMIVTILYCAPMPNRAQVFPSTDPFLLYCIFILFLTNLLLLAMIVTIVFNKANLAVLFHMILFVVPYSLIQTFYFSLTGDANKSYMELSYSSRMAICLLPTGAIQVIFKMLTSMALKGDGVHWKDLATFTILPDMNLAMVMAMMLVSCVLLFIVIWYLDAVWPWQYGVPKKIYFPFTKSYWCGGNEESSMSESFINLNAKYFESEPVGMTPGIVIRNLTKKFKVGMSTHLAVDDVSLNIYSGQITALLGRNGAGKTTTVSMLTGLFPPDFGNASINDHDIRTNMLEARKNLGICPQDNIHFPTLTVEDHLWLIAGMKGMAWRETAPEIDRVLKLLSLSDKKTALAQSLSGGMKRKLSLALALIGGSNILFLDEPTSGLDPESRRQLWDILLAVRHDKTIVLTTHYMEEADVLGDRIAIMVNGKLQCCGSSIFLKQQFGTGYHLILAREKNCDIYAVLNLLQQHIPETTIEENDERETKFAFAANNSGRRFAEMFKELESRKYELGIESFSMTVTTIDDVFLKVNTMEDGELDKNEHTPINPTTNGDGQFLIETSDMLTGFPLWVNRIHGFIIKRFYYSRRHYSIIYSQLIVPFCLLLVYLSILNMMYSVGGSPPSMELDMKALYGETEAVYEPDDSLKTFYENNMAPVFHQNGINNIYIEKDASKFIIDYGTNDLLKYLKKLSVGFSGAWSANGLSAMAWYNGEPYHTLPISLTMMHTAILRNMTGDGKASLRLTNAPLPEVNTLPTKGDHNIAVSSLTAVFISLILAYVSSSYALVAVQECAARAKLLQLMTGLSSFTYWFGMFLWDMLCHSMVCVIFLIPFAIYNIATFFTFPSSIGSILLLFLLFGWSSIPMAYIVSRFVQKPNTGSAIILTLNFLVGVIVGNVLMLLSDNNIKEDEVRIAVHFLRLIPIFSVTWGVRNALSLSFDNSFCTRIPQTVLRYYCAMDTTPKDVIPCCSNKCGDYCDELTPLLTWKENACGRDVFYLVIDGFLYFGLLLFLETGIPGRFCEDLANAISPLLQRLPWKKHVQSGVVVSHITNADADVLQEMQEISHLQPGTNLQEALVVSGLKKNYGNLCAVNNLSFAVQRQECFGLLGVNGAGKTSTFKMLAGDIFPTEGNAFINGHSLQKNLRQFQSHLGYCPQFDALIDLLTGREMLRVFAYIRGIPSHSVDNCVDQLINSIDLQEHANKMTKLYSGGNKRKLSLGLALIGNPSVILLDEPTAGVDPVSRRKIWHILTQAQEVTGASVVLCSHSMEECEALCSRLAIMVKGQFRCLGSIQHLKAKFGQGFTVIVKFKNKENIIQMDLDTVKNHFLKTFPLSNLEEYHQGIMHFYIKDANVPWSHLFGSMEQMKETFNLEDYFISGTTLEQIFLAFAHQQ